MPNHRLKNKKVLITLGSTREYFDPVRFLSNGSSGKMGLELAKVLRNLGAKVTLVCGPGITPPSLYRSKQIVSTRDLLRVVEKEFFKNDIFISASAVSDWRPKTFYKRKLTENKSELLLPLIPNPDVLAAVAKRKGDRICVGFALENSVGDIKAAHLKMVQKNCDLMVLNDTSSMGSDWMRAVILFRDGRLWKLGKIKKRECAKKICEAILSI